MLNSIHDKTKGQILDEMASSPRTGERINEVEKAAISVKCSEDIVNALTSLEAQLKLNSDSSDRVGNKIFWLNIVLAIATAVGAAATVFIAIKT
ncbi:hypothetical protein [Psychromonas sp. SR45-3]|uniref:hypothetical protein n=1 Tax=Psychromonas sp. SR45-3 TaxID=2760930 RepID=UPI0015F82039|nr:hypothetical protein [Psychromonas sp. SR45-3]MBB1274596.1 hypothetical protein [Psychromonas sp. SR45-3]